MSDFEKLGVFYLGREHDMATSAPAEPLLLYDSKDLTTHAVIIGMTGSGKTGLGVSIIEEAAMDRIPVIAIDPKGDLGNLMLTFPDLAPADFRPWINERDAEARGATPDAYAAEQAAAWRAGLAEWGEDGARIAALRANADFALYTPGSTAGIPISVVRAFGAPPRALRDDADLYRDKVQATVTSILGLVGIDGDPLQSREHILLSALLDRQWSDGRDYDIAGLITALQKPPIDRVGVLDVESFFPAKDRFALAMRLNALLAAPGFSVWMQGEALDAGRLLYGRSGKPKVSIISIAHLQDDERMFFVSLLLAEIIGWMRTQPGTPSLRAILYMDELFGYMPPVANPPAKQLFLTLLKQARAYGLGVVLATQNPVDLDYKGLSNTGTWFIGRLQTERDKARVMEGLEGAAVGGVFDKAATERILAGLGKRVFYMHNVHDRAPAVFTTRWTMSYLAGPMTREQIKSLRQPAGDDATAPPAVSPSSTPPAAAAPTVSNKPVFPPGVPEYFLPTSATSGVTYRPMVVAAARLSYTNVKYGIDETREAVQLATIGAGPIPVDWAESKALGLSVKDLASAPVDGARFEVPPTSASDPKQYAKWNDLFQRWARSNLGLTLHRCTEFGTVSAVDESERDFRIRLQTIARERRDADVAKLRQKYESKIAGLRNRLARAQQRVAAEQSEATQAKISTAVSIGSAVLGAIFGRKTSMTEITRVGAAARGVGRAAKQASDVGRANETVQSVQMQLDELQAQVEAEATAMEGAFDAQTVVLDQVVVKPKAGEVQVHLVALGWAPLVGDVGG